MIYRVLVIMSIQKNNGITNQDKQDLEIDQPKLREVKESTQEKTKQFGQRALIKIVNTKQNKNIIIIDLILIIYELNNDK